MKKIVLAFGAAALIATGLTSCGNGGSSNATDREKALGDSVAIALGEFAGAQSASQYQRMKDMQPETAAKFSKEAFIRGVQDVLNADTTQMAYYQGLQMGLQLVSPIIGINNDAKIPVNKDKVLAAFKAVYNSDSIADMNRYYAQYQNQMQAVQEIMKAREDSIKANSPEAKQNLEEGKAYIEKMKGEGYTVAPSGIAYKIENPGTEPKVAETDLVMVKYDGKNIKGETFDTNADNVRPMRANGFVPGFKEALTMLGKGGKMTVVIPADQAYGTDGAGDKIGPNQTLVFDIEILDINPENK
ncbi:MAG: FKBP-type peptidyl-prolyl cis-trans isomerase [Muribaculaceae bacterium]|nr:FKBP-type peptidyl-prolyl cis-trans isomerase [Muribaculaceae bacterium]